MASFSLLHSTLPFPSSPNARTRTKPYSPSLNNKKTTTAIVNVIRADKGALQYQKLGDSDLNISEITLGTMTFGQQNTEKEAREILCYAFDNGINALDTAEADPKSPAMDT